MIGMAASPIETGGAALRECRWSDAARAFRGALDGDQAAEALLGLGQALWWLGDLRQAMAHLEQGYAAFRRRPDPVAAAACALRLAFHHHGHLANPAAADGWLARASRLIEEHQLEPLQGELLLIKAYLSDDAGASEAWARDALARGKAMGDVDLELCSLSQLGAALVAQGRVDEGLPLLGEAMAACLGGETANLETVVFASCRTMVSCARCADFARAVQWVRAAERVAVERSVPLLHAECRTVYTDVLFATGAWDKVEETAKAALALSQGQAPAYEAAALATLAELRLAQGRLEEAEQLLAGFESNPAAVPVLARLQLQSGNAVLAAATVRRRLDLIGPRQVESARLLELLGEAEIAQGHVDVAAGRGRDLAALGAACGCRVALARGQRLEARAVGRHDPAAARQLFDRALATFTELAMPYEAARTQAAIAETVRQSDPEVARSEGRHALAGFERLGATGDANRAAALLRELGMRAARAGTKGLPELTTREREVLQLLGEGLSNPQIAQRLFVSRKTAEHHVARILDKLGLKSRAQAAAEAVRRLSRTGSND
jgi:DNA-binding CsgD family transcriptional regulator